MALQPFQDEQLNYFKFASIVLNEFPKALRQTFKSMWDNTLGRLPGFQPWDDSIAVRNMFLGAEGGKTKVPTNLSYEEWDCTALFQATIYARSFALPDSSGHHKTLGDLYVKPHKLAHGSFHAAVESPRGNEAETFALAIDQLRLLRNLLFHSTSSEIVKATFDLYIQHAKDAFKALGVNTDPVDVIGDLTESDFPIKEVRKLEQAMKEENRANIKFLQGVNLGIDELRELLTAMKADNERKEDIARLEQKINDLKEALAQDKPDSMLPCVCENRSRKTSKCGSRPSLPTSCLPPKVPHFTGRQRECEEVAGHVASGSTRIVSIWGSPGFGKTSIAIAVGYHLHSQGLPVYCLSLRGLQSTADLASNLLSLFRRPVTSDQQNQQLLSIEDELFHLLSIMPDPFTIILDNADELLSGRPEVKEHFTQFLQDVLKRAEKATFVIGVRESLEFMNIQFQGHQGVRICPLDESSSQNLIRELLPKGKATTSDRKRISQICGHVPLAIKLLCAAISEDDVEPSEFLNDLESDNVVEMLDNPDYPSHLRLKFLFDSSFQKLSPEEKEALVSLSVLPEDFDLSVAAAVLGKSQTPEATRILHNLRRKSFLDSSSKPGSFAMHQLILSFAKQRGEDEMKEVLLKSKARLCAFYVSRFEKLNEKFLAGNSMSAFVEFYEDEQSITRSLIEGCSDSKTANSVFEVLVNAELFLYSVYWRKESNFNKIYKPALQMARKLKNKVSYRQLLVSKALYQVTWSTRGNTMLLLSEARNLEESCSPVSVDDKGKRLCYSGVYLLVHGQTKAGVRSLKEAVSLMSGTLEKIILKNIAIQILATYHRFKNNSSGMSEFFSKSIQECQSLGTKQLLFIPPMGSTGKKTEEKGMTQQPLKLEIISLVIDAAKHLIDPETKRCIIDAAQEITNDIGKSPVQNSLGSFVFQCNANVTLQYVMRKDVAADKISCHETAVDLRERPWTAPAQKTRTTNKLFTPSSKQSLRFRRPATADKDYRSRVAKSYDSFGDTQHEKDEPQSREQAIDSRLKGFGGKPISTAESYDSLGITSKRQVQGGLSSDLQIARRFSNSSPKLSGDHTSTTDSYNAIGITQHELTDSSLALQSKKRALNVIIKLLGEENSSTADSYQSLGITQHELGDFSSARKSAQCALDIRRKLFGEEHSSIADSYHSLGIAQHEQGEFSSALQSAQRALDIRRKLFGEEQSSTADSYHSLGITQHEQGDFSSALQSAQRALDIRLKLSGEEHSSTADSYYSLGSTQRKLGDFSSALQNAQRALDIRRKLFGEEHSSTADSHHLLGIAQHELGEFSSALQSKQHALDIRLKGFGQEHSSTADSYQSLGITQHELSDFTSALQSTQRALDIRLKLIGEEHSSTADSYHSLGITQRKLGDFSSALQSAQCALDIRRKLFGEEHSSTADSYHLLGIAQYELGDFSSARQSAQCALDIRRKLFGEEHLSTADCYHSLEITQHEQGDFSSALQCKQRALDIRLNRFGEEHSSTADSYQSLGITQHELGDFSSARQSAQRALDIRRKLFGEEHSSTADSYHSLGITQHEQGDFSSALQCKQRALDIRLNRFGEEHSSTADSYQSLGITQHELGDFSSARQSAQRALDIRRKLFGEEHSSTADSYHSLGITQHEQGDFSSALQCRQRALDIRLKLLGEEHSSTADSYYSLGSTQRKLGDFSSALQSAQCALDIRRKLFGEEHSSTADNYQLLGLAQHEQGEFSSALQSAQRALDIRRKLLGEEHSNTADSYYLLGLTQQDRGDVASALQSIQCALDIRLKLLGEEHSSTADSYHLLGIAQHELCEFSSALQSKQRALDIRLKLFGDEHSSTAESYHSLGATHYTLGDFTSDLQSTQRALDIRLKLFGEEHSSTADSYFSLGDAQHTLGDFTSALQSAQRALDIRLRLFGEEHSSVANSRRLLQIAQRAVDSKTNQKSCICC